MMHGHEKSDSVIVAAKPVNKVARPAVEQSAAEPTTAEPVEPRAKTKGNADQQSTCRAPEPDKRVTGVGTHSGAFLSGNRGGTFSRMRQSARHNISAPAGAPLARPSQTQASAVTRALPQGIEYRWAEHRYDRLPEMAAHLD